VTTSIPPSNLSPDEFPPSQGISPLLGAALPVRRSRRPVAIGAAAVGAIVLALGAWIVWLRPAPSPLPPVAFSLPPDPEPAVTAPAQHDFARPTATELPSDRLPLDKALAAMMRGLAGAADQATSAADNSRAQRWEIRFPYGNTVESYARQLDSLEIELGVIGGGETIRYASGFTHAKPAVREAAGADEQRLYMIWRSGPLRDLDFTLLSRADISASDKIVAQFYPPKLAADMADSERKFAGKHAMAEVRRTAFALTEAGKGYTFTVVEQEYFSGEIKKSSDKPADKG